MPEILKFPDFHGRAVAQVVRGGVRVRVTRCVCEEIAKKCSPTIFCRNHRILPWKEAAQKVGLLSYFVTKLAKVPKQLDKRRKFAPIWSPCCASAVQSAKSFEKKLGRKSTDKTERFIQSLCTGISELKESFVDIGNGLLCSRRLSPSVRR
jgi:hypothetical protein